MVEFIMDFYQLDNMFDLGEWYNNQKFIGYKGIINEKGTSNELRLSSVAKNEKPICYMTYNKNAFSSHCKDYKEYKEWEKNRNPVRYQQNKGKLFDRKNVAHAVRLMHMGIEVAQGEGIKVDRTNIDRDFIMNIRNGDTSYEEIISYLENKRDEMERVMKTSKLPEKIDPEKLNKLLIKIRKKQFDYTFANEKKIISKRDNI